MTVIVRRTDCDCGAMAGLFFTRIMVERGAPDEPVSGGAAGIITEYHYPHGWQPCSFYLGGLELSPERVRTMILNNAESRPPRAFEEVHEAIGARIADNVREMNNPGRAAAALDRYAEMPDNP